MMPFDKRAFASKQPSIGTVVPDQDLYQNGTGGKQVRAFSKGQDYKLTRKLNEWDITVVDNEGHEHQLASWSQHFTYKDTGLPLSTHFTKPNNMTPYEIKEAEKAIEELDKLIVDTKVVQAHQENALVLLARLPELSGNAKYDFEQARHKISDSVKLINYYRTQRDELKVKLYDTRSNIRQS